MPRVYDKFFGPEFADRRDRLIEIVRRRLPNCAASLPHILHWLESAHSEEVTRRSLKRRNAEMRRRDAGTPDAPGALVLQYGAVGEAILPGDGLRTDRVEHALVDLLRQHETPEPHTLLGRHLPKGEREDNALKAVLVCSIVLDPDASTWLEPYTDLASRPWKSNKEGQPWLRGGVELMESHGHEALALLETACAVLGWLAIGRSEGASRESAAASIGTTHSRRAGASVEGPERNTSADAPDSLDASLNRFQALPELLNRADDSVFEVEQLLVNADPKMQLMRPDVTIAWQRKVKRAIDEANESLRTLGNEGKGIAATLVGWVSNPGDIEMKLRLYLHGSRQYMGLMSSAFDSHGAAVCGRIEGIIQHYRPSRELFRELRSLLSAIPGRKKAEADAALQSEPIASAPARVVRPGRKGKPDPLWRQAQKRMIALLGQKKLPDTLRRAAAMLHVEGFKYSTLHKAAHRSPTLQAHFNLGGRDDQSSANGADIFDELTTIADTDTRRTIERFSPQQKADLRAQLAAMPREDAVETLRTLAKDPDFGGAAFCGLIEEADRDARRRD